MSNLKFLSILALGLAITANNASSRQLHHGSNLKRTQQDGPGEPLYLTPLIKEGRFEQAQEAALAEDFYPTISYSGFITVNEEHGSNLFFWFFPAESTYVNGTDDYWENDLPVILWNDGGPGMSCMYLVFNGHGPFNGSRDGTSFTENPYAWSKKHHVIFIDNPVTVGFSHVFSEDGYVHTDQEAARDMHEFMTQFFQLFPHLQKNPFYTSGVSYGGTYSSHLAYYIHQQNQINPFRHINLAGVIHDSPYIASYWQIRHYGNILFNAGLLSDDERKLIIEKEDQIRRLLEEESFAAAYTVALQVQVDVAELTGFDALSNYRDDQGIRNPLVDMAEFLTLDSTRRALHVGNISFSMRSTEQVVRMADNIPRSSAFQLDEVLKNGYRYLVYVGNMDVITANIGFRDMLDQLTWSGKDELLNGERKIWKIDNRVAGYVTNSGNATYILMRNAGHGCSLDEPKWVKEAVDSFLEV